MTARDTYSYSVRCPKCGRGGTVEASENDGYSFANGQVGFRVESVPSGFVVSQRGRTSMDTKFACVECKVDAA